MTLKEAWKNLVIRRVDDAGILFASPLPPAGDWRSTDEQEILRRTERAREEKHAITRLDDAHPVLSAFAVKSPSGMTYQVEIRDLAGRAFSCTCPDFRTAGLGTCKHVEATLLWLKRRHKGDVRATEQDGSPFVDIVPGADTLRVERNLTNLPPSLRPLFDADGRLNAGLDDALAPSSAAAAAKKALKEAAEIEGEE